MSENYSAYGVRKGADNAALVIIGVTAPGFRGETVGQDPDLWLPLLMQPLVMPGWDGLHDFFDPPNKWLYAFGRRKPVVTIAEVQAEMNVLFRQIIEADYSAAMTPLDRKAALNQDVRVRAVRSAASIPTALADAARNGATTAREWCYRSTSGYL